MPADPQQLNGSWTMSLQSTIEQALSLREEIKQSLATAESHSWLAMATDKITLPTFYFQYRAEFVYGQYRQVNQPSNHSSFAAGRESNVYTDAGLYFNWPLFNSGVNTAEANALRKSSMQAEKQAELDRLTVTSQVQTSHASYISSLIVVDSAADEVRSSLIALREARDDFGKGKTNATTLVQILASVRKATDDYRDAVTKHNISVAELYRYSASWPDTALPILQRKVQQLRHQ